MDVKTRVVQNVGGGVFVVMEQRDLFEKQELLQVLTDHERATVSDEPAIPLQLIGRYVAAACRRGMTEQTEDGRWYAEVQVLPGVWAEGDTEEQALTELRETVEEWVQMKISDKDRDLPLLDGIDLNLL
jgi:predicted RNase H-like HicB family nuclease